MAHRPAFFAAGGEALAALFPTGRDDLPRFFSRAAHGQLTGGGARAIISFTIRPFPP